MKDGYRYIDGKIEITDYSDNGTRELEHRHYQDNIEEILITENTIEELQKRKDETKKDIEENINEISERKGLIPATWVCILAITLVFGGSISVILNLLLAINNWSTIICSFIIISIIFNKIVISPLKEEIKELTRDLNGNKLTLQAIKEELGKNKEMLKVLKANMTRDREDEIKNDSSYRQLSYVEKLEQLNKELDLYYCVGFYENEMIENYKNDTLDALEENGFEKEQIKTLKRILEKRVNLEIE